MWYWIKDDLGWWFVLGSKFDFFCYLKLGILVVRDEVMGLGFLFLNLKFFVWLWDIVECW